MCLAVPGKIKEIKGKTAIVEYPGQEQEVLLDPHIEVEVGDFVRVQMMMVIDKISEERARAARAAWEDQGASET